MQPKRRPVRHLDREHQADHDMAHDRNGEIGRGVVGALMVQRLGAMRTVVGDFEVTREHQAHAASRTFERSTPQHGAKNRPLGSRTLKGIARSFSPFLHHCS
jgi:hypothetical protein